MLSVLDEGSDINLFSIYVGNTVHDISNIKLSIVKQEYMRCPTSTSIDLTIEQLNGVYLAVSDMLDAAPSDEVYDIKDKNFIICWGNDSCDYNTILFEIGAMEKDEDHAYIFLPIKEAKRFVKYSKRMLDSLSFERKVQYLAREMAKSGEFKIKQFNDTLTEEGK